MNNIIKLNWIVIFLSSGFSFFILILFTTFRFIFECFKAFSSTMYCNLRSIVISFQRIEKTAGHCYSFSSKHWIHHAFVYASAPLCFIVSEIFFNFLGWWINFFFFSTMFLTNMSANSGTNIFIELPHTRTKKLLCCSSDRTISLTSDLNEKILNFV